MALTGIRPQPQGGGQAGAPPALLEARGLSKSFPGVKALADVNFRIEGGQVHALVGENGAGKSTLMKCLSGLYQPDEGQILFKGQPVTLPNPLSAQLMGISVIHQELFHMPHLTVAQNIYIGREPKLPGGLVNDDKALNRQAGELLDRLGVNIDPKVQVGRLTVAAQQMVEIAKAMSFDAQVLIMDEPTAALTESEVQTLFRLINGFVDQDHAVVYISHRMEEIKAISSHITVLRDGAFVDSRPAEELSIREVIQLMVGRKIDAGARPEPKPTSPDVVLKVEGLSTPSLLRDVSFELHRGEILGFAGLMGAGRTETARAIVGADPKSAGRIWVDGTETAIKSPADAVRKGIGYLSEDRKRFGLILGQSVAANIALPNLGKFLKGGLLDAKGQREAAEKHCRALSIKTPSVTQLVRNLSGGNQQKVVLAKWLERDSDILIFDEPTRGIDVGAKQEIYDLLDELIKQGKSLIVISSEMEEVLRVSDRIAVMCNGRITGVLDNRDATQENIMELATQFTSQEGQAAS